MQYIEQIAPSDQPSQTLAKGLLILGAFSHQKPEWGIRELARELDLNPATVVRLTATLQNMGYLERIPETQRYHLGPMIVKLARVYAQQNPLSAIAKKIFEAYADKFQYNFYLGQLNQFEVLYLAVLDGRGPIKITVTPGGTTGLHTTAIGKILLAHQDDTFIQHFIDTYPMLSPTERSITTPEQLWEQIRHIRREGIAVNDGEHFDNVAAIGAPIYDESGTVIAGVSLAYPRLITHDNWLDLESVSQLAREIAAKITLQSGGILPK